MVHAVPVGRPRGSGDPVVLTQGLVKRFGAHTALAGLDLSVRAGEVFGFIGPNGAGKSTTIRLLLDLLRPTAGRVEVFGVDPRTGGAALRRRIAYLPGDLRLHDRGRVDDVFETFIALRYPRDGQADRTRAVAAALAERLDLDLTRPVRSLSKGNRQKVGLVLAFMPQADLLVLDEPTSGLDPLVQQEVLALVRAERDAGRTVFMSSHVLTEVEQVADRVGIIRAGALVDLDDLAALRQRTARLVQVHLGTHLTDGDVDRLTSLPGVNAVQVARSATGTTLTCSVSGGAGGGTDRLVSFLAGRDVLDLTAHAPDLEDLFLTAYAQPDPHPVGRHGD